MRRVNVAVSVFIIIGLLFFIIGASGSASTIESVIDSVALPELALMPTSNTEFNIYPGQTATCSVSADSWPYGSAGTQIVWYLNSVQVAYGVSSYTTPSSLTVGSYSVVAYDSYYGYSVTFIVNVNTAPAPSPPPQVTYFVGISGAGSTSPSVGYHTVSYESIVYFSASPSSGYEFSRWESSTGETITSPSFAASITASKTYTAYFTPNPTPTPSASTNPSTVPTTSPTPGPTTQKITLTMSVAGSGSTSPPVGSHQYDLYSLVQISCTPSENYHFQYWQLSDNTRKYTVTAYIYLTHDVEAKALFYYQSPSDSSPYPTSVPTPTPTVTLTMGVSGQGTISPPTGTYTYYVGSSVTISASPASGYVFSYWLMGDGSKVYTETSSLSMTQSKSALAVFALETSTAPSSQPTPQPTPMPTTSPTPSPSATPDPTPLPIADGTISYDYINANEAAMTIGLTIIALSGMGGVLANPNLFGRRRW